MAKKSNKPILTHKGISFHESFKGGCALSCWYALVPHHQA